jgi:capsular polysaccharide biosynthesis protein
MMYLPAWLRRQRAQQLMNFGMVSTVKAEKIGSTLVTSCPEMPFYIVEDAYLAGTPPIACRHLDPPFEIIEESMRENVDLSGREHGFIKRMLRHDLRSGLAQRLDDAICLYLQFNTPGDWIHQQVPKVLLAEEIGFRGTYLIPPVRVATETMALIGIPPDRLVVHIDQIWKVGKLWMPPWSYHGMHLFATYPDLLVKTRNAIMRSLRPGKVQHRIYVSRNRPGTTRQIVNEPEFKAVIARYGFVDYFCEDHSVAEQVIHFAESEAAIGPNGSGFINTMFMPEDSTIVELFSPLRHEAPWSLLPAKVFKQRYYEVMPYFPGNKSYAHGDNVVANIDLVEKTLKQELT